MMPSDSVDTATQTDKLAGKPFNLQTADVSFRTCDGVFFRLHKAILSIASPFFEDMFSLAQPQTTDTPNSDVIVITENSQIFDSLLRHFYPADRPEFSTLVSLVPVLEAALKYQITSTVSVLRTTLVRFLQTDPLDIYAIACRLDLPEEAQLAAEQWRKAATWDDTSSDFLKTSAGISYRGQIWRISAVAYFNLVNFMRTGTALFSQHSDALANSTSDVALPSILEDQSECDVVFIGNDASEVYAHSFIIRLVCGEGLFGNPVACTASIVDSGQLPEPSVSKFNVGLGGRTLRTLIVLCYPQQDMQSISIDLLRDTIQAALDLKAPKVVHFIRQHLRSRIAMRPFAIYRIAVSRRWKHEAQEALQHLLTAGVSKLTLDDLDGALAYEYWQILRLEYRYREDVLKAAKTRNIYNKLSPQWRLTDGGLVELLRTAPCLMITDGGQWQYCHSCQAYGRGAHCKCIIVPMNKALKACGSLQEDMTAIAAKIASEHLATIVL